MDAKVNLIEADKLIFELQMEIPRTKNSHSGIAEEQVGRCAMEETGAARS